MNSRRFEVNKSRLVMLLGLFFAILGASLFRTPAILLMAGVGCAAPICAALVGRWSRRFLRVSREFPTVGSVGDEMTALVTLQNDGKWPVFLVHCNLNLEDGAAPGLELGSEREHLELVLAGRARVVWEEKWRLTRRGEHPIPGVRVGSLDPLGLQVHLAARAQGRRILVLPKPLPLARLGWTGESWAGQRPPRQAARVAEASDFHGVRAHRPGEGLRRIHWKSTARTGQLHVVEWEEEMAHDMTLLLDVEAAIHAGAPGDDSLEAMVALAASIAAFLLQNGHCFSLMWLENTARHPDVAPARFRQVQARSLRDLEAVLRALALLDRCDGREASLFHLVAHAAPHLGGEAGVLLVTTERADLEAAQTRLDAALPRQNRASRRGGHLLLDAASFAAPYGATGGARETSKSAVSSGFLPTAGRRFRRGDSLVAFLEVGA
ncbi:MAG TPA: DUF58 domain-containing protein [Abditibacterium sp.]|jgi:uncharacterized protein (DUF58 family)